MNEESYREWQEELRQEGLEERADDRRYANRSAEEVLEDIEEAMSNKFGEILEDIYILSEQSLVTTVLSVQLMISLRISLATILSIFRLPEEQ